MAADVALPLREELRYEIPGDQTVSIAVEPLDHKALPQVLEARLINLSAGGAKLAVATQLPPHKTLRVRLRIVSLSLELYVSANVCWASHSGPDQCILGCRLTPRIPEGMLSHLAAGGRLDRRDSARLPGLHQLQITRDRRGPEAVEWATVHNYSPGGLCLETTSPSRIGERMQLLLDLPETTPLMAVTRWQLQQGGRCILGCGYLDSDAFERLEAAWRNSSLPEESAR